MKGIIVDDKINLTEKLNFLWEGQKTIWEKEKMLVTSIFSIFYDVLKSFFSKVAKSRDSVLTHYQTTKF